MQTRASLKKQALLALVSQLEPKKIDEALKDEFQVNTMKEKLKQFERNQVWAMVKRPDNCSIIETKLVFRNKMDEDGKVI